MRICTVGIVGFLLLVSLRGAAAQSVSSVAAERVVVPSGALRLTGLLWKPTGSKHFPAVLFNHGGRTRDLGRPKFSDPYSPNMVTRSSICSVAVMDRLPLRENTCGTSSTAKSKHVERKLASVSNSPS